MPDEVPLVQQLKPSTSTVASVLGGGTAATILLWAAGEYLGFSPPPEISAQIGIVISAVFGYFFSGGRSETSL